MSNFWMSSGRSFSTGPRDESGHGDDDTADTMEEGGPDFLIDKEQDQSEQYGLFNISTSDEESLKPPGEDSYAIDFVAVHGLGGDAYRTWTHQNGYMWLHHIKQHIPGSRIYSFGYDSGFAFSRGTGTIEEFGRSLLEYIRSIRTTSEAKKRSLVFICHSMGGLVVKQAFLIANNEVKFYPGLKESIPAIIFLGTPHQGSSFAEYGEVLGTIANAFISGSQASRVVGSIRTDLLQSLKTSAPELQRIARDFRIHTDGINITSFIEQKTMKGLKTRVVDEKSGVMNASTERIISMQGYDHRDMCKHASLKSQGLILIFGALKDAAETAKVQRAAVFSKESALAIKSTSPETNTVVGTFSASDVHKNASLLQASRTGSLTAAVRLLENGADLHAYDEELRTPLHLACLYGHSQLVEYFVVIKKASISEEDSNRMQPLHLAAKVGNQEATRTLLEAGALVNQHDKDGFTALHYAAISGDDWTAYHLMSHGGNAKQLNNDGISPTRLARRSLNFSVMRRLQGAVSQPPDLNNEPVVASAPMRRRKLTSPSEVFQAIIFFDVDSQLSHEDSELYEAVCKRDVETVENLLDEGHLPSAQCLYTAAKEGYSNIVKILVNLVKDIDEPVGKLGNSLCAAAASMSPQAAIKGLQILLENGADVNWQGGMYGNALQAATANYRLEMVKMLLQYGADANAQGGHYGNSMTAAARHYTHFQEMTELLLDHKADINAQGPGEYGNPLQTAVWLGHLDSVKFLLDRGANKWVRGRYGSALDIARRGTRFNDPSTTRSLLSMLGDRPEPEEEPEPYRSRVVVTRPGLLSRLFGF